MGVRIDEPWGGYQADRVYLLAATRMAQVANTGNTVSIDAYVAFETRRPCAIDDLGMADHNIISGLHIG